MLLLVLEKREPYKPYFNILISLFPPQSFLDWDMDAYSKCPITSLENDIDPVNMTLVVSGLPKSPHFGRGIWCIFYIRYAVRMSNCRLWMVTPKYGRDPPCQCRGFYTTTTKVPFSSRHHHCCLRFSWNNLRQCPFIKFYVFYILWRVKLKITLTWFLHVHCWSHIVLPTVVQVEEMWCG